MYYSYLILYIYIYIQIIHSLYFIKVPFVYINHRKREYNKKQNIDLQKINFNQIYSHENISTVNNILPVTHFVSLTKGEAMHSIAIFFNIIIAMLCIASPLVRLTK